MASCKSLIKLQRRSVRQQTTSRDFCFCRAIGRGYIAIIWETVLPSLSSPTYLLPLTKVIVPRPSYLPFMNPPTYSSPLAK
jgi:hypothetical protein